MSFVVPSMAQKKQTAKKKATTKRVVKKTTKKKTTTKTANYSNASIKGLRTQRVSVQRKIKEQERLLRANKADVKKRLNNLMMINSEIDQRQKSIEGIQKDITHIDGNIGMLKNQLATLEQQLQDRKAKYIKSMRYMASNRTIQDKLMFIFSAKNFAQMYRRLRFVREYAAYQRAQGEMVKAKQSQIEDKNKELQRVRGHKNNLLYKGQQERAALQGKQAEQQLRNEVSEFALKIASKVVRQQLSDDKAQARLVGDMLDSIEAEKK